MDGKTVRFLVEVSVHGVTALGGSGFLESLRHGKIKVDAAAVSFDDLLLQQRWAAMVRRPGVVIEAQVAVPSEPMSNDEFSDVITHDDQGQVYIFVEGIGRVAAALKLAYPNRFPRAFDRLGELKGQFAHVHSGQGGGRKVNLTALADAIGFPAFRFDYMEIPGAGIGTFRVLCDFIVICREIGILPAVKDHATDVSSDDS